MGRLNEDNQALSLNIISAQFK